MPLDRAKRGKTEGLDLQSATRVVRKNFDRMTTAYADYLQRNNLLVYTHEMNLYRKIISIYEARKGGTLIRQI